MSAVWIVVAAALSSAAFLLILGAVTGRSTANNEGPGAYGADSGYSSASDYSVDGGHCDVGDSGSGDCGGGDGGGH